MTDENDEIISIRYLSGSGYSSRKTKCRVETYKSGIVKYWSYNALIAFCSGPKGFIYLRGRHYSNTTSRHRHWMFRYAFPKDKHITPALSEEEFSNYAKKAGIYL